MENRRGKSGNSYRLYFPCLQNHCRWWLQPWNYYMCCQSEHNHEIKRHLLLGRKAMTNLESVLKSIGITFMTTICIVKAMFFPVVVYRYESWTIKKAEHQVIGAFKLWCWRRPLRVLWTARRSNQSILKEINPEYSLEGLMLKLKFRSFGHLMGRAESSEKTLILGKIEGRRRRGRQGWDDWMTSLTQWRRTWENSGR